MNSTAQIKAVPKWRKFRCSICLNYYLNKKTLKKHFRQVHLGAKPPKAQCIHCHQEVFKLQRHIETKHKLITSKQVIQNEDKLVAALLQDKILPRMMLKDFLPLLKKKWQLQQQYEELDSNKQQAWESLQDKQMEEMQKEQRKANKFKLIKK